MKSRSVRHSLAILQQFHEILCISMVFCFPARFTPRGFASKVRNQCGMKSVPPRGSGWVDDAHAIFLLPLNADVPTHPLPRGGTDLMQV